MGVGTEFKSSGVSENTPKNVLMGAGTLHKGLEFNAQTKVWNFAESLLSATSGGNKLTIAPEVTDIAIDGVLVKAKGLTVKTGETASMEVNVVEITPEMLKTALIADDGETSIEGYSEIVSKSKIEEGDYISNLAYVGKTLDGRPIIVIFDHAICTSGLELEGKDKESAVIKLTFDCVASLDNNLDKLPYHIYYPTPAEE